MTVAANVSASVHLADGGMMIAEPVDGGMMTCRTFRRPPDPAPNLCRRSDRRLSGHPTRWTVWIFGFVADLTLITTSNWVGNWGV
jgi:hypothetical protein